MKVVIIGGVIWLATAFMAWVFCKAAGDADDSLGMRDGEE